MIEIRDAGPLKPEDASEIATQCPHCRGHDGIRNICAIRGTVGTISCVCKDCIAGFKSMDTPWEQKQEGIEENEQQPLGLSQEQKGNKQPHREKIERLVMPHIRAVVSPEDPTEKWEDKSLHFPVDALFDALNGDGFDTDLSELRDNGWQWDWWLDVEKDGRCFTLEGSGFNGGLAFYPCED